jgi:two-component system, NarL family, response regulator DevR
MDAKVLIVRDDRLMFEGLVSVLSDREGIDVVGVASSAADAVEKSLLLDPDLVLMDTHLSDSDGWQACERIRSKRPNVAVMFLSADVSDNAIERAVLAGAAGYLSMEVSATELIEAIRKLAEGEMLVTASTLARMLRVRGPLELDAAAPRLQLTAPEREVLARIAGGMDNRHIADELRIDAGQVRGIVRAVLEKLGVHSKVQAVDSARRAGLLPDAMGAS